LGFTESGPGESFQFPHGSNLVTLLWIDLDPDKVAGSKITAADDLLVKAQKALRRYDQIGDINEVAINFGRTPTTIKNWLKPKEKEMAIRKTVNLLPTVFQTDRNEKFLNATLDQLISPASQQKINGYVGRKFSPSYNKGDPYIQEDTDDRQNYQLEPGVVYISKQDTGNVHKKRIEFLTSYSDIINRIKFYGGDTTNHDRLFQNEYYNHCKSVFQKNILRLTQIDF